MNYAQFPMYYRRLNNPSQVRPDEGVGKFGSSVVMAKNKRRTTLESWSFTDRCINDLLETDSISSLSNTLSSSGHLGLIRPRMTSANESLSFLRVCRLLSAAK